MKAKENNEKKHFPRAAKIVAIAAAAAVLVAGITVFTVAYFSGRSKLYNDEGMQYYRMGMELNTFFDMVKADAVADGTDLGIICTNITDFNGPDGNGVYTRKTPTENPNSTLDYNHIKAIRVADETEPDGTVVEVYHYIYDHEAVWGSPSNPYIISKMNHLQNLYVLQNAGYFTVFTGSGDSRRKTEVDKPYFLVSTNLGEPVTIDGTDKNFEYIGSENNPFVGYVGGAFKEGTTEVAGKQSPQSAIYNVEVKSDEDVIDIGLFGHVGYLGEEGEDETFEGTVSVLRDLVLADVRIKVVEKTAWEAIVDATRHLFSFSGYDANSRVPHETNHIGILAGHVEYGTVENISVYYSDDATNAIDVSMTKADANGVYANFYSVSGILGYVHDMNSKEINGIIHKGGSSNVEIEVPGGGVGSGGGLETGEGRGYVTAEAIYNAYRDNGQIVRCKVNVVETNPDGSTYTTPVYKYGLLIEAQNVNNPENLTFTLADGTEAKVRNVGTDAAPKFVARVSFTYRNFFGVEQTSETEWPEFIMHDISNNKYYYYEQSGGMGLSTVDEADVTTTGISLQYAAKYKDDPEGFTRLCTRYERQRIIFGEQATDRFYFYDGVFTFALSDATDTVDTTWKNGETDTFYVGPDNASQWQSNTSQGNKAFVSYVKQITTNAQLRSAIDSGKKLFLAYEYQDGNGTQDFIVTLAGNSDYESNLVATDDTLLTNGTVLSRVDDATSQSIRQSIASGTTASPIAGVSNSQLAANWGDYKLLNLGDYKSIGSGMTSQQLLAELKEKYLTDGAYAERTAEATYKDDQGNVFPPNGNVVIPTTVGNEITENNLTHAWDGFIAFETGSSEYRAFYGYGCVLHLTYVKKDGTIITLRDTDTVYSWDSRFEQPYEVKNGVTPAGTQYGVNVYSITIGDKTYKAPLLYLEGGKYYAGWSRIESRKVITPSGDAVIGSDHTYYSTYSTTHKYFTAVVGDYGTTYKYLDSTVLSAAPVPVYEGSATGEDATQKTVTIGGVAYNLYSDGVHEGILLNRREAGQDYIFSSTHGGTKYTLRLLRRQYTTGRFSIACLDDSAATNRDLYRNTLGVRPTLSNSTGATLIPVNDGTGRFYISYTVSGTTRYLAYAPGGSISSERSEACFRGVTDQTDYAKITIYSAEGYQDINYGYVTYEPTSGGEALDASEYVLMANQQYNANDPSTNAYKPTITNDTARHYSTDPTYSVRNLEYLSLSGWRNGSGNDLTATDLNRVFNLGSGVQDLVIEYTNAGEISGNLNDRYVKAPIGSLGEEVIIPVGCVAFRVTTPGESHKVRALVAVPASEYYYNQSVAGERKNPGEVEYNQDYYFCLWKYPEPEARGNNVNELNFTVNNCQAAVELPRSNPYAPGTKATDSDYYETISGCATSSDGSSVKKYITITDGGTQKRAYLNGSVVLVACEFSVPEQGVYLIGSNKASRIVYFSVDSTANSGMDGTHTVKLGTIDFVYDNGSAILPVTAFDERDSTAIGYTRDYTTYYYPTMTLLYTDNAGNAVPPIAGDTDVVAVTKEIAGQPSTINFANINDFAIRIRRKKNEDSGGATIYWQALGGKAFTVGDDTLVADADYIQNVRYAFTADTIERTASAVR